MAVASVATFAILIAVTTRSIDGNDVAHHAEVTKQRLTESMEHLLTKTQLSEGKPSFEITITAEEAGVCIVYACDS